MDTPLTHLRVGVAEPELLNHQNLVDRNPTLLSEQRGAQPRSTRANDEDIHVIIDVTKVDLAWLYDRVRLDDVSDLIGDHHPLTRADSHSALEVWFPVGVKVLEDGLASPSCCTS